MPNIPPVKAVYAMLFTLTEPTTITVGSLGSIRLSKRIYAYIGSARGSGGLRARVKHHLRRPKHRMHWHIDYITVNPAFKPLKLVYIETSMDLEEKLVERILSTNQYNVAVRGFGSSDKKSISHLLVCESNSIDYCLRVLVESIKIYGEPKVVDL